MTPVEDMHEEMRRAKRLASRVAKLLKEKRQNLAIAESCTGGLISHVITDIPGISRFLKAAVVPYALESKTTLLGVPQRLIARRGVVSESVACRMSSGVLRRTGASVGLGVTGFCGPGTNGSAEPVGRVCIAVSSAGRGDSRTFHFRGDRQTIKWKAAMESLRMLARYLATL